MNITVHVIGAGFGESIVIEFPNGNWGVVDCFCARIKPKNNHNPTLRFLKSRNVDKLAFLAYTHPHQDHGMGLSHILNEFKGKIKEFWIHSAFSDNDLLKYFGQLVNKQRKLPLEEHLNLHPGTFRLEQLLIYKLVLEQSKTTGYRSFESFQEFEMTKLNEPKIKISFLGPNPTLVKDYKDKVNSSLKKITNDELIDENWNEIEQNHNLLSPAILIQYGSTKILLGGDMEHRGWEEVKKDLAERSWIELENATYVKVCHHGSSNGYTDELYQVLSRDRKPICVITPYNRNKNPLPSHEGLIHILPKCKELYCTNLNSAKISYYKTKIINEADLPHINKSLARIKSKIGKGELPHDLLNSDTESDEKQEEFLNVNLITEIRKFPELAKSINKKYQSNYNSIKQPEVNNIVSFSFDNNSNVVSKQIGEGAGKITLDDLLDSTLV